MASLSSVEHPDSFFVETRFSDGKTVLTFTKSADIVSTGRREEEKASATEWVASGATDNHLNAMKTLAESSTVILPGLRFNASMRYGGGIEYGKEQIIDGEKRFVPMIIDEVENFLEQNKIFEQVFIALLDIETFGFCVFQHALSLDRKKIVQTNSKFTRASWVRMGKRSNGNVDFIHVNADFGTTEYRKENVKKIKAAPEFIGQDWITKTQKEGSFKSFCTIHQNPDLGRLYYPLTDWYSAVLSGWYDVAKLIAESKKFLFQNQFAIKYHIKIHPEYWKQVFGADQWAKFTQQEKASKKQEELQKITDYLQGTESYGSTFFSERCSDFSGQKFEDSVTIEPITHDFSKSGEFMKESNEATDHMLSAMSIHPDIIGNAPGSSLGSGSGSGNRVAFNQRVALSLFHQQLVLDALRVVSSYNGWGVKFRMRNSLITTLDTGASATKPNANIPTAS